MNFKLIHIIFLIQILKVELTKDNNDSDLSDKNKIQEEIIELDDSNFDSIIQNGYNNRWLILFYLEKCYHCYRARTVLNRVLEFKEYKNINNIKFASIEINRNSKSSIRFNVNKVPYIVLVENKKMLELDSYVSESKIIDFIETNFTNVTNDLIPFPQRNLFKYYYKVLYNSLDYAVDKCNEFLASKNIKFKFSLLTIIITYSIFCLILWSSLLYIFFKCFDSRNNSKKIKQKLKNNEKKDSNEDNNKNEPNDDSIKSNKNLENDNINDEEKKKRREENKEKKEKMKKTNESEKKNDNDSKKQKKKKKE